MLVACFTQLIRNCLPLVTQLLFGCCFSAATERVLLQKIRSSRFQPGTVWTDAKNRQLVESLDKNSDGLVSEAEFIQGFDQKCPEDLQDFTNLMMEYEAAARWVRGQRERGEEQSSFGVTSPISPGANV